MTDTPGWISPEHYRTGTTGPEGDMFAWGALVAHAATGRRHPTGSLSGSAPSPQYGQSGGVEVVMNRSQHAPGRVGKGACCR